MAHFPRLVPWLALLLVGLVPRPGLGDYPHLRMGNPSRATDDPDNKDNYLMKKEHFALSYNNAGGTPNWVSWQLTRHDLGNVPRRQFHPDTTLPRGFYRV